MNYSKEFFEWTKTEGEWSFTIKDVSGGMTPGNKRDIKCDGIGFNKMIKEMDGTLMLEMIDGSLKKFIEVKESIINSKN